jgi:hypothetical protein
MFQLICWALLAISGAQAVLLSRPMLSENSVLMDQADENSPTGKLRAAMGLSAQAQLEVLPTPNGQSWFAWLCGMLDAGVPENALGQSNSYRMVASAWT